MGATTFMGRAKGLNASNAFTEACKEARYLHGHGGYTGTIAEKSSFVMISLPAGVDPADHAYSLLNQEDSPVDDKWGPAGCIDLGSGEFLFFGWASS